jgi:3-phenylpropionate/trans-cinnamate dioxygenase ferredoxin reductase subunit
VTNGAVVVGASIGGLRAAERLRSGGWDGPITVVGAEPHLPYQRPPLTKDVLRRLSGAPAGAEPARPFETVALRMRASVADVDWRLGRAAVRASLAERTVWLDDGADLRYDALVVATGLRSRRLDVPGPSAGRHAVRTLDDAVALAADIVPGASVVVVGAGFVGCEVAATAAGLGCAVAVVEPLAVPMERALGVEMGTALRRVHERRGVRFLLGRTVVAIGASDAAPTRVGAVVLDDGSELAADVVVESVGSLPNVEWLDGNGLDLSDGVLCDGQLRTGGHPDVVAVGDVARFPNPRFDDVARRVEHWSMPTDAAKRAAATVIAHLNGEPPDREPFAPIPTFWSDQFGVRLQSAGMPALADAVDVVEGNLDALDAGVAVEYRLGRRVVGTATAGPAGWRPQRPLAAPAPAAIGASR